MKIQMQRRALLRLCWQAAVASGCTRGLQAFTGAPKSFANEQGGSELSLDLAAIPFSCAGSYLTLSPADESVQPWIKLATVRKTAATYRYQTGAWSHDLYRIGFVEEEGFACHATLEKTELSGAGARASITFDDPETLRFHVVQGSLLLIAPRAFDTRVAESGKAMRAFDGASGYQSTITVSDGAVLTSSQRKNKEGEVEEWLTLRGDRPFDATLRMHSEQDEGAPLPAENSVPTSSLREWMAMCPHFAADTALALKNATKVGWFLFWNLQVVPAGAYRRTAVLSSKRSLSQVWSWDNLFNAQAIVREAPELAWAQLWLILDHQKPDGSLPDTVNDDRATYGFVKPPLWAWTVERLLASTPTPMRERMLREIYPHIAKVHKWWFEQRDVRGDGVPVYLSGNDSGWDNASIFAEGTPVQSPDLLALLTVDAQCLSRLAAMQGLQTEADAWRAEGERLKGLFHSTFVRGDELVYWVSTPHGWEVRRSTSLLTRIPLLMGADLNAAVRRRMVKELGDPAMFAAASGPASESLSGPLYDPNGYWRGPVWGPSTLLICEGLRSVGERALAAELARRYRITCARKADFRENYDARTGEGRYDTGMTWSSADYLLLGHLLDE